MGVTRYSLRHATRLQGDAALPISSQIKLLIFSRDPINLHDSPFCDLCFAFHLDAQHILCLTPQQYSLVPEQTQAIYWFIDTADPLPENSDLPSIHTPLIYDLMHSPAHKKALWNQFCRYENYFNTHSA